MNVARTPLPHWAVVSRGGSGASGVAPHSIEPAPAAMWSDQTTLLATSPAEATGTFAWSPIAGVIVLAVWVACGVLTARAMGRRGHDIRPLVGLGLVLGPLLIPVAREQARRREGREISRVLYPGEPNEGPVGVLIGLVGPPETVLDVRPLLEQIGPCLGKLAVAITVDFDSVERDEWDDAKQPAALKLELAVALLSERYAPGAVLVGGAPLDALVKHARAEGYDLLALAGRSGTDALATSVQVPHAVVVAVTPGTGLAPARGVD